MAAASAASPLSSSYSSVGGAAAPHSPWHSPIPYLFGGLAAMLGLIALALLILAFSYWKLSPYFESAEDGERDVENGEKKDSESSKEAPPVYQEKIVVIMAGDTKPTFLATPISSRPASSFGDHQSNDVKVNEMLAKIQKPKDEGETSSHHHYQIQQQNH